MSTVLANAKSSEIGSFPRYVPMVTADGFHEKLIKNRKLSIKIDWIEKSRIDQLPRSSRRPVAG